MCVFAVRSSSSQTLYELSPHQRDEVSEGHLDLNLHLVFRMNHRANILAVAREQVFHQVFLLITTHCMET